MYINNKGKLNLRLNRNEKMILMISQQSIYLYLLHETKV